jgi:opacity protein-like surface antigen
LDPRDLGLSIDVQGANVTILSVSGELKASIFGDPDKVSPYVMGGFGIAHLSTSDTTSSLATPELELNTYDYLYGDTSFYYDLSQFDIDITTTIEGESETKMTAIICGGVDIPISERVEFFAEGRYQLNFTEDDRTDFASLRGGVRIGM